MGLSSTLKSIEIKDILDESLVDKIDIDYSFIGSKLDRETYQLKFDFALIMYLLLIMAYYACKNIIYRTNGKLYNKQLSIIIDKIKETKKELKDFEKDDKDYLEKLAINRALIAGILSKFRIMYKESEYLLEDPRELQAEILELLNLYKEYDFNEYNSINLNEGRISEPLYVKELKKTLRFKNKN